MTRISSSLDKRAGTHTRRARRTAVRSQARSDTCPIPPWALAPPSPARLLPWERKRRAAGVLRPRIQRKRSGERRRGRPQGCEKGRTWAPAPHPRGPQGRTAHARSTTRNPRPQRQVRTCSRRSVRSGVPHPRAASSLHSPCTHPQDTPARPQRVPRPADTCHQVRSPPHRPHRPPRHIPQPRRLTLQ